MKWVKIIGGGVLGLLALAFVALLALSKRAEAGHMTTTIEIARSPAEVRTWFQEPAKLTQWVAWLVEVKPVGARAGGPGSQQEWFMADPRDGGRRSSFVRTLETEDDSSTTITIGMPGMFDGRARATYHPLPNGGTRLVSDSRFTYATWFWALLEPLVTPEAHKKEVDDLARLKARIEATPAGARADSAPPPVTKPTATPTAAR